MWKATRRNFLIKTGAGLGLALGLGWIGKKAIRSFFVEQADKGALVQFSTDTEPQYWFEVQKDNTILFHSPKIEMGQGVFSALAQIVAEELEVSINQIKVVHSATSHGPIDPNTTGGSDSISSTFSQLSMLAALMREMLRERAVALLGISLSGLSAQNGYVVGQGKKLSYAKIVAQTSEWSLPDIEPTLKKPEKYQVIGKPLPRVDLEAKVKAEPIFGIDATFPDMVYAAVVRSPYFGAVRGIINAQEASKSLGVIKVVEQPDFVAVVAKSRYEALMAKEKLQIEWTSPTPLLQQKEVNEIVQIGKGDLTVVQENGDLTGLQEGEDNIKLEFHTPLGAHAQMEPNGVVAYSKDGKAVVKMSTQSVKNTRNEIAEATGIRAEDIDIQPTFMGGGFGRRLYTPHAYEAVVLSQEIGLPVHVLFEREQEFQNGYLRPPTHHKLSAKLNNGKIEAIEHQIASGDVAFGSSLVPSFAPTVLGADFGAWRGGLFHYENIQNNSVKYWRCQLPFFTSWWRGLGLMANSFAIESFVDELAKKAKQDPINFRIAHIKPDERGQRLIGVLKEVQKISGFGQKVLPEGHAMGVACATDVNTPVAQVAEVKLENGAIKVLKVYCAIDPGLVINPDGVKAQCEGAISMGLSASMFEELNIEDGKVTPNQYLQYQMAQIRDIPDIEVSILSTGDAPRGVGEPPMGPIAPAIANAVATLTGTRMTKMPFKQYQFS